MNGIVFDVQRFCVHDGPGIRTTVFMKGCPLRCRWCHNPEGLYAKKQLQFFEEKCIGCGACGDKQDISCAEKCPADALKICGRSVSEDEILSIALKDKVFYGDTGGITFSGGECLMQADFVAAVLSKAKDVGLNTAVDTSGYVPWQQLLKTVDVCDLYLYDIKCINSRLHKEFTGVDNSLILDNARRLSLLNKNIWIRVPVVPGFNDTLEEMKEIADFVSELGNVKQVTLMPYHTLGVSKYKTLGFEYPFNDTISISSNQLKAFSKVFEAKNVNLD